MMSCTTKPPPEPEPQAILPVATSAPNLIDIKPDNNDPSPEMNSAPNSNTDIPDPDPESPTSSPPPPKIPRSLTLRLYTSHFLSTWNSRVFEFAAVLFLAHIYPGTLLPMSVYALCRSAAAILFSRAVGWLIDTHDRLSVVRWSIVVQRVVVAGSCGIFVVLERGDLQAGPEQEGWVGLGALGRSGRIKDGLFGVLVIFACIEKLAAVMNLVAVERDWVVVMTEGNNNGRRALNSRMRRIDLMCKLVGPLVISLIDGASTIIAIWTTLGMNMASVLPEYIFITRVYQMAPTLAIRHPPTTTTDSEDGQQVEGDIEFDSSPLGPRRPQTQGLSKPITRSKRILTTLSSLYSHLLPISSLPFYFRHPAFLPSFSVSLLYLTVLSFSGQMITFLLSIGYTSFLIGALRTIATVFELSATWIAPRLMKRIGPIRAGIWSLSWQMLWLAVGICWLFSSGYGKRDGEGGLVGMFAVSALVGAIILSRVGLWGFDLCAQIIVQDEVEEPHRGTFSTVEASFQNLFELLSFASTIVFDRPDQFQWPIVLSVTAVYVAGGLYTWFLRRRRGHLFHVPQFMRRKV